MLCLRKFRFYFKLHFPFRYFRKILSHFSHNERRQPFFLFKCRWLIVQQSIDSHRKLFFCRYWFFCRFLQKVGGGKETRSKWRNLKVVKQGTFTQNFLKIPLEMFFLEMRKATFDIRTLNYRGLQLVWGLSNVNE